MGPLRWTICFYRRGQCAAGRGAPGQQELAGDPHIGRVGEEPEEWHSLTSHSDISKGTKSGAM